MGILLMYDVTSLESFNNLSYWLRNIQEVISFCYLNKNQIKIFILFDFRMHPRMLLKYWQEINVNVHLLNEWWIKTEAIRCVLYINIQHMFIG